MCHLRDLSKIVFLRRCTLAGNMNIGRNHLSFVSPEKLNVGKLRQTSGTIMEEMSLIIQDYLAAGYLIVQSFRWFYRIEWGNSAVVEYLREYKITL